MALILNIETSGPTCSVALARNGKLVGIRETHNDKSHAAALTVFIDELLKEQNIAASNLDAVAVSQGPGSYTGLRIGVATAKGLAYGAKLPFIAIDTLQSMANGYLQNNPKPNSLIRPMLDARRMEVYTASYTHELQELSEVEAKILDENSLQDESSKQSIYLFGSGANKCIGLLNNPNINIDISYQISASHMISLSETAFAAKQFEDIAYYEPLYLKEFVATIAKNKVLNFQHKKGR